MSDCICCDGAKVEEYTREHRPTWADCEMLGTGVMVAPCPVHIDLVVLGVGPDVKSLSKGDIVLCAPPTGEHVYEGFIPAAWVVSRWRPSDRGPGRK